MLCTALNASDFGDIHSFALICFLVRGGCTHFVNLVLPVHLCFFWMWKRTLIYFLRRSSVSPSHVAHAHQKWFPIDFITSIILHDDFLLAASNLFLMFLAKCHTSNWWIISGSSSLKYFLTWECRSVVICSGIIPSFFNNFNDFWNPFFSVRLEFPTSETWIKE